MTDAGLNSKLTRIILEGMSGPLSAAGFSKRAQLFRRSSCDLLHLVALQKSQQSSARTVRLTVNLAVWVPSLAPERGGVSAPVSVWDGQWRQRLGHLMPGGHDVWWAAESEEEASVVAEAVVSALKVHGLPAFVPLASTRDLLALWQAGTSPGLTVAQRDRFRGRLQAQLENSAP